MSNTETEELPWELANAEDLERTHLEGLDKLLAVSMLAGTFFVLGLFML